MEKLQFVNHLLKELVDESIQDVALTGYSKITQKLHFLLTITKGKKNRIVAHLV